jgi:hypothetical protein
MAQNFCTNCGSPLEQLTRFCPHCGAPLQAFANEGQPSSSQQTPPYPQSPYPPNPYPQSPYPPNPYPQNPYAPYGYAPQPMPYGAPMGYTKPKIPGRGLAIASMVLGIIAFIFSLGALASTAETVSYYKEHGILKDMDIMAVAPADAMYAEMAATISAASLYLVLSILAISFAGTAIYRKFRRGQSISGLILGILSFILFAATIILAVPFL